MFSSLYPFVVRGLKRKIRGASMCQYARNSFLLTVDTSVGEEDILSIIGLYCKKAGYGIKKWKCGFDLTLPTDTSGMPRSGLICVVRGANQPKRVAHVVVTALTYLSRAKAIARQPGRRKCPK